MLARVVSRSRRHDAETMQKEGPTEEGIARRQSKSEKREEAT